MLAKEEEHWTSFRSAVVCLQYTLSKLLTTANVESSGSMMNDGYSYQRKKNPVPQKLGSSCEHQSEMNRDACNECASHRHQPQDITSNNILRNGTNTIDTNSDHRQLQLIGLEKVHISNSWNSNIINMANTDHLISPAHGGVPSNASYATNALSIAEQQLAETRLKLAMTESERDELEFQLIQGS